MARIASSGRGLFLWVDLPEGMDTMGYLILFLHKKYYVKKHAGCGVGLSLHSLHKHISITYALYVLFPMERRREAARFLGFIQLKII